MRFVFVERPLASPKGPLEAAWAGGIAVERDVCEGDGLRKALRCAYRRRIPLDIIRGGAASERDGAGLGRRARRGRWSCRKLGAGSGA